MKFVAIAWLSLQFLIWISGDSVTNNIVSLVENLRNQHSVTLDFLLYRPAATTYEDELIPLLLKSSTFANIAVVQLGRHSEQSTTQSLILKSSIAIALFENLEKVNGGKR